MKEKILELRALGYSYNRIVEELGCSKGTIAYHCGEGQKQKSLERQRKNRKTDAGMISYKMSNFRNSDPKTAYIYRDTRTALSTNIKDKIRRFHGSIPEDNRGQFEYTEFMEWLEQDPVCYLSGRPLDFSNPRLYHFDHIIPRCKGGTSNIDNLGVTTSEANQAKHSLSIEEFLELCIDVLVHWEVIEERPETE